MQLYDFPLFRILNQQTVIQDLASGSTNSLLLQKEGRLGATSDSRAVASLTRAQHQSTQTGEEQSSNQGQLTGQGLPGKFTVTTSVWSKASALQVSILVRISKVHGKQRHGCHIAHWDRGGAAQDKHSSWMRGGQPLPELLKQPYIQQYQGQIAALLQLTLSPHCQVPGMMAEFTPGLDV